MWEGGGDGDGRRRGEKRREKAREDAWEGGISKEVFLIFADLSSFLLHVSSSSASSFPSSSASPLFCRFLLKWLTALATLGVCLLIDWSDLGILSHLIPFGAPDPLRYCLGQVVVFAGLQASESVIMSTLSKVVHPKLAAGTFNSGLLATELGTLGRAVGDTAISAAGFVSMDEMINLLNFPNLALLCASVHVIEANYNKLDC